MKMVAIGNIHLKTISGEILKIASYYSPDISGTIVSPDAIARQYKDRFQGFRKICDCHNNKGYLILDARSNQHQAASFRLESYNHLWYHVEGAIPNTTITTKHQIHSMSQAASYELWHQRLCHPGTNVMQNVHKHTKGIPRLKGNSFWKCPSCMNGKCDKSYHITSKPSKKPTNVPLHKVSVSQHLEEEDDFYLPQALPGQHFHFDFGSMRTKDYQYEDVEGKTQTSVDGKNAYLLVVDRSTRYMWVYVTSSKQPPLDFCKSILHKFKSSTKHCTVRCDQGELATLQQFNQILVEEGFNLEVTGAGNSKQNGLVERPHQTLARMVRCSLHAAALGPEYWSYALLHGVYIKNRLPHQSIKMSPYQAFTGKVPDMTGIRIFGSRVVTHNTQQRSGKLDMNNINQGIFVGFTNTQKNVYYIDDTTRKVKIGSFVEFDEAHMSVPAQAAPLAAQALQRVGYYVKETEESQPLPSNPKINVHLHSSTARHPRQYKNGSVILQMDNDVPIIIRPKSTSLIQTGLSMSSSTHDYFELKPILSSLHPHLHILPGLVASSTTDELFLIASNTDTKEIVIPQDQDLALLSIPYENDLSINVVPYQEHHMTTRSRNTTLQDKKISNYRAARMEADMQICIDLPYDLIMSNSPFDNVCHRNISLNSRHEFLGMKLKMCNTRNKPMLESCIPGHAACKIPYWREQLKGSYITAINDTPVTSLSDIRNAIKASLQMKLKDVKVTFATIDKQAMHPQYGIPQIYHDQLGIVAQHIFKIQHEQPVKKEIHRFVQEDLESHFSYYTHHVINKIKKKFNSFTLKELKQRDDWMDWNASIFK